MTQNIDALDGGVDRPHFFKPTDVVIFQAGPWMGLRGNIMSQERDLNRRPAYRVMVNGQETTADESELSKA